MKLQNRIQLPSKRNIVLLILTYVFLLLLSRGFVVSGDDWFFSSRTMDESLPEALLAGYRCAKEHYFSTNGRLIGNALSSFLGCSEFWREIVRCTIIFVILLQVCKLSRVRSICAYCAVLVLVIALPVDIYRQCYAWAAGFFNYVPPLLLILYYFFLYEKECESRANSLKRLPVFFFTGLFTQFFVENISIGIFLLSAGILLWERRCRGKWSFPLALHLAGCCIGCVIMFAAPGYSNVNVEGYREVSTTLFGLLKTIYSNFSNITMYITERNWLLIIPLTALALLLMLKEEPTTRSRQRLHRCVIFCLMLCPVWFYVNYTIMKVLYYSMWVAVLRFLIDVIANFLYLASICITGIICLKDPAMKRRAMLCIASIPLVLLPLVVVSPIGPRCMYVPYILMVCLILLFADEFFSRQRISSLSFLKLPIVLITVGVLSSYLWVSFWNGHYEDIRVDLIHAAMEEKAKSVSIPNYPYMDYIHNPNAGALRAYYYYRNPGDFVAEFIPNKDWYLNWP